MLTNIDIDEALIAEVMKISGARSKREAVDRALRELVARSRRTRFSDIWGMGGIEPDYDPKASPGEPPGIHRVEEARASYKVKPARPAPERAKPRKRK